MKKILVLLVCCSTFLGATAQDAAAEKWLSQLAEKYEAYETVEMALDLALEWPEQAPKQQAASLTQSGDKFKLITEDRDIYGDGERVWLFLKNQNEVQLNNYDEDAELGILTPKAVLRQYETGAQRYRVKDENDRHVTLELVPTDRDSEYSKYWLTLEKSKLHIDRIKAFGKDGSRVTATIAKEVFNKSYDDDYFVFDRKAYPDVYFEDLRID